MSILHGFQSQFSSEFLKPSSSSNRGDSKVCFKSIYLSIYGNHPSLPVAPLATIQLLFSEVLLPECFQNSTLNSCVVTI